MSFNPFPIKNNQLINKAPQQFLATNKPISNSQNTVIDPLSFTLNNLLKSVAKEKNVCVFEIENSERILQNIIYDLNNKFIKIFDQSDSVYIFKLKTYYI